MNEESEFDDIQQSLMPMAILILLWLVGTAGTDK